MQLAMPDTERGTLSHRAKVVAGEAAHDPLGEVMRDPWDPKTNPKGFVNLGLSENWLMRTELCEYINASVRRSCFAQERRQNDS